MVIPANIIQATWNEQVALYVFRSLCMYTCTYTYVTTINLKRGLEFEKNQDILYTGFEGKK